MGNGKWDERAARAALDQLHRSRFEMVLPALEEGELALDSGSARAEDLPGWPKPRGGEDIGGFIVLTDRKLIYADRYSHLVVPWAHMTSIKKRRMWLPATTGIDIACGKLELRLSGNTPFVKDLLTYWREVVLPSR